MGSEPQPDWIKLTYREQGTAKRSAATLALNWNAATACEDVEVVRTLRQVMEEQNTKLAKAYSFHRERESPAIGGGLDWKAITTVFLEDRLSLNYKVSTQRGSRLVCDKFLVLMASENPPSNGPEAQKKFF